MIRELLPQLGAAQSPEWVPEPERKRGPYGEAIRQNAVKTASGRPKSNPKVATDSQSPSTSSDFEVAPGSTKICPRAGLWHLGRGRPTTRARACSLAASKTRLLRAIGLIPGFMRAQRQRRSRRQPDARIVVDQGMAACSVILAICRPGRANGAWPRGNAPPPVRPHRAVRAIWR